MHDAEATLADLQRRDVLARIWHRDHTVWRPRPDEITNRLGWLTVADTMRERVNSLEAFAQEVRTAGFERVMLLGMGGSSLGPEVLRQTFGTATGYPDFTVLDSTIPASVQAATEAINPARTLFLVSSRSGTTIETESLYRHFRSLVERAVSEEESGQNFAAITDPGTPLEELARKRRFRRTFSNPPDIGGRFSVLSYVGLVPAALMGIDVMALLDRCDGMREACAPSVPAHDNPAARLGAVMGTLALKGRDKLTLAMSPSIESSGLWVEQLVAESTGKEGKGIVPITGEPVLAPEQYGDDRLFVYLRLEGDDNAEADAAIGRIESSGQPVLRLAMRDRYDLGAEFFRWELATAVAGAILGVHPFDQPDVERAKDLTGQALAEYRASGRMSIQEPCSSLQELLSSAQPGEYLAVMAYVQETPEMEQALVELRRRVTERYHVATTLGYGPRFLHSTGQLHKGGPPTGMFLQITARHQCDVSVPGKPYTFGVLADAQATGDLQALREAGRRVARIHLDDGDPAAIKHLAAM